MLPSCLMPCAAKALYGQFYLAADSLLKFLGRA